VVLDATFLKHAQRQAARHIADDTGVPYLILDCQAPESVIAGWLAQRQAQGGDPSDATLEVVQAQQAGREALDADEQAHSKRVDTQDSASLDTLVESIRQRLPGI
jgi:predicted kinase